MKKRPPNISLPGSQGFTLIEIMITLVVLALVAALASPAIMSMAPDISLKSAASDLFSNLQRIKVTAIKENRDYAIVFDTANNQYVICNDPGADNLWSTLGDNATVKSISLTNDYSHGIKYGHGNVPANNSADTPPAAFPADEVSYNITVPAADPNVVVFNSRGFGNPGWVYLAHKDDTTAYAIGSRTSGVIQLRKWIGGSWQ